MKIVLLTAALLLYKVVEGQYGLNVVYSHVNEEVPAFVDASSPARMKSLSRLVFNDSMSFSYGMSDKHDPMQGRKDYGNRVLHHSTILDCKKQKRFGGSALASSSKKHFYIVADLTFPDWIFEDSVKYILGHRCRKAFLSTIRWIQADSAVKRHVEMTHVWYAEKIPVPFGPMQYYGLPGLVLEVYDQRYMGKHIRAVSLQKDTVSIQIPPGKKVYTANEWKKKQE